jgi:MFS family permease
MPWGIASASETLRTGLAPLQHKQLRIMISARLASALGNSIAPIALAFAVLDLTGSTLYLGEILAARTIPLLLFVLFGGAVADRIPGNKVLVWAGALSAVTQSVAAISLLAGHPSVYWLMALEAVNGASTAFIMPATQGLFPQLVPKNQFRQANVLYRLTDNGMRLCGAALAGILVVVVGSGWSIAVDAATFTIAALLFTRVKAPGRSNRPRRSVLRDLRDGWTEFTAHRWLTVAVVGGSVMNMAYAGAWNTLGPAIADHTFGRGWWGVLLGLNAAGVIIGALAMMRLNPARPMLFGALSMIPYVPLLALLALYPNPLLLAVASFTAGLGLTMFGVVWQTALQEHVPAAALSRVSSYNLLGAYAGLPLGQIAAGYFANRFDSVWVILTASLLCAVAAVAMVSTRSVRTLHRSEPEPEPVPTA